MAYGSGMSEAIIVGFEQTFKVLPATFNAFKVPVISPRYTPAVNRFTSDALSGNPQPRPPAFGKQGLDWTMEVEANKDCLGPFFKGHFGAALADQAPFAQFYDHYFGFTTMLSMAHQEMHSDLSKNFAYQGLYGGSMDVTLDSEGLFKATFGGMGAFQANKGSQTIVNGTTTDYTGAMPLNMVAGVVKLGGTVVAYFQQVAIRSNRGLDKRGHIDGTTQVGVIYPQLPTVEITIRATFQDTDLLDQSINSTETSLEFFVFETGTGYGVKFIVPTFIIRPASPETAGTGLVNVNVTGDAYARGSASDVSGEVLGKYLGTSVLTGLNTKTLVVKPDALTNETFTFTSTEENGGLAAVVTKINATAVGLVADSEGGRLRLVSKTKGTASKINIQAASTGATILGFATGIDFAGFAAQSLMARLSNSNATI